MAKGNQLTDAFCRTAKDGTHNDGAGLLLLVGKGGSQKSWAVRIMVNGKAMKRGLGSYPTVTLAEARKAAKVKRDELKGKGNPTPEPVIAAEPPPDPRAEMIADLVGPSRYAPKQSGPTFREVAEDVIAFRRSSLTSERYAKKWPESLHKHVYPVIGDRPISEITGADVLAVLRPIWHEYPEASTRVKQRMGTIFDYAIANEYRHDNPASAVDKALPKRPRLKHHHKALPFEDVPAAVKAIRQSTANTSTRLALEFVIVTAARSGEVRGMQWTEVDGDVWEIPAERMKMRRPHRVPLSDRALAILAEARQLGDGTGLIFPGDKGKPLSDATFGKLLRGVGLDCVPHGFRASFRTWAMEQPGVSWAACERALAHNLGGQEVEAYARGDMLEERRDLMADWADFVAV